MVLLHIMRDSQSIFLYETTTDTSVDEVTADVIALNNGIAKIERICSDIDLLIQHGPALPPEMHGLNDEQLEELHLVDEWAIKYGFPAGKMESKDPCAKRSGVPPSEKAREVLQKAVAEAAGIVSKTDNKAPDSPLTQNHIQDALDILQGSISIAYPMQLPYYDPIVCELENRECDLTSLSMRKVLEPSMTQLWFAGKELECGHKLREYLGKNEKTKAVVKLQKRGHGPPARQPVLSEEERKEFMLREFRRREELKKLEDDNDISYLNSDWADPAQLKRSFHGLQNISWKPR